MNSAVPRKRYNQPPDVLLEQILLALTLYAMVGR